MLVVFSSVAIIFIAVFAALFYFLMAWILKIDYFKKQGRSRKEIVQKLKVMIKNRDFGSDDDDRMIDQLSLEEVYQVAASMIFEGEVVGAALYGAGEMRYKTWEMWVNKLEELETECVK